MELEIDVDCVRSIIAISIIGSIHTAGALHSVISLHQQVLGKELSSRSKCADMAE